MPGERGGSNGGSCSKIWVRLAWWASHWNITCSEDSFESGSSHQRHDIGSPSPGYIISFRWRRKTLCPVKRRRSCLRQVLVRDFNCFLLIGGSKMEGQNIFVCLHVGSIFQWWSHLLSIFSFILAFTQQGKKLK